MVTDEIKWMKNKIISLEMEIENVHARIDNHEPIVKDYGNRNMVFRIIGLIGIVNLLLLLAIGFMK